MVRMRDAAARAQYHVLSFLIRTFTRLLTSMPQNPAFTCVTCVSLGAVHHERVVRKVRVDDEASGALVGDERNRSRDEVFEGGGKDRALPTPDALWYRGSLAGQGRNRTGGFVR